MFIFRQLLDSASATYTYLIGSRASRVALLVDPVAEQSPLYQGLLAELELSLACVVDTHLHSDHLSAARTLVQRTGCAYAAGLASGIDSLTLPLADGDQPSFADLRLEVLATPGHTPGCITLLWEDRLLTGDALLIGGCGAAGEPGGNTGTHYDSVTKKLLPLPDELLLYPGHDRDGRRVSCIGEERQGNPLFNGISRDEFIALERTQPLTGRALALLAANRQGGDARLLSTTESITKAREEASHER
ncbi:MAG TPA: MBL fold metallo-hydrolase [Azospira sp.]|nr:MBL fold metallo-hydrolase [Azospira sp.]